MASPKKINLGVFMAGEIPFDYSHTFQDSNGDPIDISGWTPSVDIEGPGDLTYGSGVVSPDADTTTGRVFYKWAADDFIDVGKYRMLIWIDDNTNRLASDLVVYEVYDGPGPTPGVI